MNVGLIDVDSHGWPNLALMKISAYHKRMGDNVEFALPMQHYDIVYQSEQQQSVRQQSVRQPRCGNYQIERARNSKNAEMILKQGGGNP